MVTVLSQRMKVYGLQMNAQRHVDTVVMATLNASTELVTTCQLILGYVKFALRNWRLDIAEATLTGPGPIGSSVPKHVCHVWPNHYIF